MKLGRILAFSIISLLVIAGSLLAFSFILLKDIEYYNFKNYVFQPVVFMSIVYGFFAFLVAWFFKSKKGLLITAWVTFVALYPIMIYEIAFEVRGDFGATWLASEVFRELVVHKGKGFYLLITGLGLSMMSTLIISKAEYQKRIE